MVLYIQSADNNRKFFVLNGMKDFLPLFDEYEQTRSIALMSHGFKDAATNIAKYLSRHNMNAWVEDSDDLSKGVKDVALKLGLVAATAMGPTAEPKSFHAMHQPKAIQSHNTQTFGMHPEDSFLWSIKNLESSGGKNTAHIPVAAGKYKGERAIGSWGLLTPTIHEIVGRASKKGVASANIQKLHSMDRNQIEAHFQKHPDSELEVARLLAGHILHRQKGNKEKAAYAWLNGHNLLPHDITLNALQSSDYVNKFKDMHSNNPFLPKIKKNEPEETFKIRLKTWRSKRYQEEREPAPRDHTFSLDPGRLRDDQEIEESQEDTMSVLKEIINAKQDK